MKKIPTWAIYLADLMCVLSALLIAGSYFYMGLPMERLVVLLCAFMVFSATVIICTYQVLYFKYAKLSKEKPDTKLTANIEENFQILFKQVSAIKRDNATLNANFTSLLNRFNELLKSTEDTVDTTKILSDVGGLRLKLDELENKFAKGEDITNLKLEIDDNFENLRADVELDLGKLEDIDNAVKELRNIIENLGNNSEAEEIENIEENTDIFDDDVIEYDVEDSDKDGVDPSDDLSQIGLMSRALNNTQQAQSILGSFAKLNEDSQKYEEEESFADIEDDIEDDLADIMNIGNNEEATLTINAMLGLGNKPYIRGNYTGLSEGQGVQMEFVEIGKWRYVFKDLRETIKVSIWLNDEKKSEKGDISISEGEALEINVNFSE